MFRSGSLLHLSDEPQLRACRLGYLVGTLLIALGLVVVTCLPTSSAARQRTAATQKAATKKGTTQPSGLEIESARKKLAELGYWLSRDATGLDSSLSYAVVAFQKIEGRKPTGVLTTGEVETISTAHPPTPLETGYTHIEVDLERQVLFLVEPPGERLRVLPISSGSGELFDDQGVTKRAETPIGRFTVYRKIDGWRKSSLGRLYYPNYIVGGVAIHGNPAVPAFPASHGCIRIPMFAAKDFSDLAFIGIPVVVHNGADRSGRNLNTRP